MQAAHNRQQIIWARAKRLAMIEWPGPMSKRRVLRNSSRAPAELRRAQKREKKLVRLGGDTRARPINNVAKLVVVDCVRLGPRERESAAGSGRSFRFFTSLARCLAKGAPRLSRAKVNTLTQPMALESGGHLRAPASRLSPLAELASKRAANLTGVALLQDVRLCRRSNAINLMRAREKGHSMKLWASRKSSAGWEKIARPIGRELGARAR